MTGGCRWCRQRWGSSRPCGSLLASLPAAHEECPLGPRWPVCSPLPWNEPPALPSAGMISAFPDWNWQTSPPPPVPLQLCQGCGCQGGESSPWSWRTPTPCSPFSLLILTLCRFLAQVATLKAKLSYRHTATEWNENTFRQKLQVVEILKCWRFLLLFMFWCFPLVRWPLQVEF